jgi:putative SOS response-associated peptidase YedK
MCGRYWIDDTLEQRQIAEEMMRSALVARWKDKAAVKTQGEIRPTDVVPVIAPNRHGARTVYPMKWGYTGRSLLINARSETAAEKQTFREDWARHRCIVPASWYFEWEHYLDKGGRKRTGDKYMIRPQETYPALTWLCGLYRIEGGLPAFVILTREPGEKIRFIHDRMPLIMPGELVNEWIRPDTKPEELMPYALTDMDFEKAL